jgi:CheY-like chemotaxis protein
MFQVHDTEGGGEACRQARTMEAVGRLAGGIAHELNNILTVISGHADVVDRLLADGDPLHAEVGAIVEASRRAAALTRQLLAFSRQQLLNPKPLDVSAVVAGMAGALRRAGGSNVRLVTELGQGLGLVSADPAQLEHVVSSLAANAREAMPDGGTLTIATSAARFARPEAREHFTIEPGRYVVLTVSDTGRGMDAGVLDRAFEPFFTTKGQGRGLGLSTVYGVVKQSGGYVDAWSEPGRGARMTVYLPQACAGEAPRGAGAASERPGGAETILLVEDEDGVRKLASIALRRSGYTVLEAPHGGEALRVFDEYEGEIDLVLTDVVMPKMSGRELAERLGARHAPVKLMYMSGYSDEAFERRGVLDGGVALLPKPFSPGQLVAKVREVLDQPCA